jgi:hypothetical protein
MDEQVSHGNVHEESSHLKRVKERLTSLVTEAPKAIGTAREKLPFNVAERTARTIWSKIKREKRENTVTTEDEKPITKWEEAALLLDHPPLPNLHTTEQMLRSASALVRTEREHKMTSLGLLLHELGFARRQQKAVERIVMANNQALETGKVREVRNPTTEGFEAYMAGNEVSLPFSTNHAEVLKDDEHKTNDVDRTASLIAALALVRNEVRSEKWEPELSRKRPLEMRGYKRAFSKRESGEKGDSLVSVIDSDHVTVVIDGSFFTLNLFYPDGTALTPGEIKANIEAMKTTVQEPAEIGAGVITTMNRRDLWQVREDMKKNPDNLAALDRIDKSLWTFILDTEAHPASLEETSSLMQYGTYKFGEDEEIFVDDNVKKYGVFNINGTNQYISPGGWYDGHSIRVAANGKAGANFEHLAIDGSEGMWLLNEIGEVARQIEIVDSTDNKPLAFEPITLSVPEPALREAIIGYLAEIEKQQIGLLEVEMKHSSANYFDSTIQIALAAAQYEVNGNKPSFAIEPMNLRHQMGGRLGYGLLNLHAIQKYVEWMVAHPERYPDGVMTSLDDMKTPLHVEGVSLNRDARNSHTGMLKEVKEGNAPLNHITTLTGIFKDELAEKGAYIRDVEAFFTALDSGLYQMVRGNVMTNGGSRDNIASFMTIASMSADGIGIGYSKQDDARKIVFTIRAKGQSQERVEALKKAIPKYLDYVLRDQLNQY